MALFSGMNIVQRNVISNIKRGYYSDKETLDKDLEDSIQALRELHQSAIEALEKKNKCVHEFNAGRHTHRRMIFGNYITVHERSCKKCGKIESETYYPSEDNKLPDWCQHTKEAYYNNDI